MSGWLKSGLLFGLIGLVISLIPMPFLFWAPSVPLWVAVIVLQIIPVMVMFGPLALILGSFAGFFGARWNSPSTMQRGMLASAFAGAAVFVGVLSFFGTIVTFLQSTPEIREAYVQLISDAFAQQGGEARGFAEGLPALLLGVGVCTGIFNLVIAIAAGSFFGWLGSRPKKQGS
jgi:hypothetical protein